MPAMNETLDERLERLKGYIESTRYALTEDDVRYDYTSGRHLYSLYTTAIERLRGQEENI